MAEPPYRVQAFNSATHSENRMHDDAVAQKYGFSGGLVPVLLPALQHSGFRQRFEGKGRYAPAMARVPTLAVLHPQPGLLGAAALAADAHARGRG